MKTIQSIDKAIIVLDYIAKNPKSRLKDISENLNIKKSTLHGIISTLQYWGYISKDSSSKYSLGIKLFQLGKAYEQNLSIKDICKPFLQLLVDKYSETVHLAILDNFKAIYVDKIESPHSMRMTSKVGTSDPLAVTAIGKAILSNLPMQEVDKFFAESRLEPLTDYSIIDRDKLKKELEIIGMQGYAIDLEECEIGLNCIASPIKNYYNKAIGAISISIPTTRFNKDTFEDMKNTLIRACNEISKNI